MICIDNLTETSEFGLCAHLFSDRAGLEGEVELLEFGLKIGLHQSWLQGQGGAHAHFDAMNSKIDQAIAAGAKKVDREEYKSIYLKKKQQLAATTRSRTKKKEKQNADDQD